MDFTSIKDMSIGNLKIKEIWYNNNLLYQESEEQKRELTLLQFGESIVTDTYIAPKQSNIVETRTLSQLKFGEAIVTTNYIAPKQSIIVDTNTLSLLKFSEV